MAESPDDYRFKSTVRPPTNATAATAGWEVRYHNITKWRTGFTSSGDWGWDGPDCDKLYDVPPAEYPKGSGITFTGGDLWIGGIRGGDTLVSVTLERETSSYMHETREFFAVPQGGHALRCITSREYLDQGPYCERVLHDEDAISELDLVSVAYDTITDVQYTGLNPYDGRRHWPLGLELTMRASGWSYEYAEDFIIVQYKIRNIGYDLLHVPRSEQDIRDLYVGILGYGYVTSYPFPVRPWIREVQDELVGMLETTGLPGRPRLQDSIRVAWNADNNGDAYFGKFDAKSLTSIAGTRLLSPIGPHQRYSFNWWLEIWVTYFSRAAWGPELRRTASTLAFPYGPRSDVEKYRIMSNGEWDYSQVETAINHEAQGWLPPPPDGKAADYADGYLFPLYLHSIGPFDLNLGDSITVAFAIVGGEHFHRDPNNFARFFNPYDPQPYLDHVDFSDLAKNAQWAGWVYDTPGFDTDGDGYKGDFYVDGEDTVYYRGDGVPDFRGPPPPPPPHLSATTEEGRVILRFNGRRSETELDPFSNRADFEGYRIYMSRTARLDDWSLLTQRDRVNYARYTWVPKKERWLRLEPPFTRDSLIQLYDSICIADYGYPFDPDSFAVADRDRALLEILWEPKVPGRVDSLYRYFAPYEANQWPDDRLLAETANSGTRVNGVIRKLYPDAVPADTLYRADGTPFAPYYEYEYALDGLQVAEPLFFAITAFDYGDPDAGLSPLESAQSASQIEVWPINSVAIVKTERPRPGVYPNPYRISDDYNAAGWENPRGMEPDKERARKVTFYNVPDTCIVSIWSLDGDLIRRLDHKSDPSSSEASVVVWNLITRNTQAIKTGIYLYSIESRLGTDVGKLVLIQ